jgi:hypothetical protein
MEGRRVAELTNIEEQPRTGLNRLGSATSLDHSKIVPDVLPKPAA